MLQSCLDLADDLGVFLLAQITGRGGVHSKGAAKIEGLNLTAPAMVEIVNGNERIFKRYGENADGGDLLQELLYVDKDGNIDPTTPVQYDYSTITRIRIYSVSDAPIRVGNAKIETRVPNPKAQDENYENNYCYYNRGIRVQRSNATVYDIDHSITGEDMSVIIDRDNDGQTGTSTSKSTSGHPEQWGDDKSYGVPYNGFFAFEESYNVTLDGCILQGHQAYNFYNASGARNEMGSYDLYARHCIKLNLLNLTQRENYGDYPDDTVITNRFMYHGVMGTYHCRNMVMDNCYLDRFDSHKAMHNARITNSTLGFGILVIGGGELYVENVYRIAVGSFILLREDYNSHFDGDIIIKNCRMGSDITSIIGGNWYNDFNNGLQNHIVNNLTIDGLHSENEGEKDWSNWGKKTVKIHLWSITERTSGTGASNPICGLPATVRVRNVTSNAEVTKVKASANSGDAFADIGIITEWSD